MENRGRNNRRDIQSGIALLIVLFIVALASIVVINLSFSTFIQSRTIGMIERQLQAEYILKSLVNFSAAILEQDVDRNTDSFKEPWGIFRDCLQVPSAISAAFGVTDPAIKIYLEISPVNMKIPLGQLKPATPGSVNNVAWHEVLARLFEELGFDKLTRRSSNPGQDDDNVADSKQLVSNLYAYLTPSDETPQAPGEGFPTGIRAPSQEIKDETGSRTETPSIKRVQQLIEVPGFTAKHVQMIKPYLHESSDTQINVNVASARVLRTLPQLADYVQNIIEVREGEEEPFKNLSDLGRANVPAEVQNAANSFMEYKSKKFEAIGKVEYGSQATYFISAQLARDGTGISTTPMKIESMVLY